MRLFEGFTAEQLRLLAFGAEQISLPPNRRLYREDDEADSAYVVVAGSVIIFREQDGERLRVASVGPGSILGEIALITDTRRMTSAEASLPTEVLRLNRKMFHRILEEYPEVAGMLYRRILDDFQRLVESIEGMAPRFAD